MIITLDFETYYDKAFSLTKLTTEEYIRDDRFEVIGVAVAEDDGLPIWYSGSRDFVKTCLQKYDWDNSLLLAHNMQFDGAILNWHFGIKPKGYLDTLCMARAVHGVDAGGSLKALAERYNIGEKGTEVLDALGKRRVGFTPEELDAYGRYCCNDVELTRTLFHRFMLPGLGNSFPTKELKVIDTTLKMFIQPTLVLQQDLLIQHLENVKNFKTKLLESAQANIDDLMSSDRFAELLKALGVVPPTKVSARTGKEAWAFAKTDEEFKALLEHTDPRVQALVSARLGNKTTLEETRTQRFIDISSRGLLPVPIKYYAAHTGRWGGDDKINLQNLPSRGNNAGKLKKSICAPAGYMMIDCDSSQIEARTVAWLAGQDDLVEAFDKGEDVYKIMASSIYGKPVEDITKEERFVGKTTILGCFGAATEVLTDSGWKRIVTVQATDLLWDGEEWVKHQGLVPQGEKEVLTAWGLTATPDHEILTEHGWLEWKEVCTNPLRFLSALNKANLPSSGGLITTEGFTPTLHVLADGTVESTDITLKVKRPPDAMFVLKKQAIKLVKNIGGTKILSLIGRIGSVCLTAYQVASHAVIQSLVKHTRIMVVEGLQFTNLGALTEKSSYATLYHSMGGMTQKETLTASTTTLGMHQTIYGLRPSPKMQEISDEWETLKHVSKNSKKKMQTYDIAYAGARNRYTVKTAHGAIIVHNCGYGMGAQKFQVQLKTFGVEIEADEANRIIQVYRKTYDKIPELWKQAQKCVEGIVDKKVAPFGAVDAVKFDPIEGGFLLPSGLWQRYDGLERVYDTEGKAQYQYKTRKGAVKIYGGKVVENLCQAIARCVIAEQMLLIGKKYRVVLTVHDAVEECMKTRPSWAQTLPLSCESGVGKSYGEC